MRFEQAGGHVSQMYLDILQAAPIPDAPIFKILEDTLAKDEDLRWYDISYATFLDHLEKLANYYSNLLARERRVGLGDTVGLWYVKLEPSRLFPSHLVD